jgi:hypothetical protein
MIFYDPNPVFYEKILIQLPISSSASIAKRTMPIDLEGEMV